MTIHTPICDLLDIEHPILLAPMAGVSGGRLAAAVTAAGGLGLIGGGYGNREWLEGEFTAAGGERVGVGFITWSLARQPQLLMDALECSPAVVMLSFGDFRPFLSQIRRTSAKLIVQVQTLGQARAALAAGVDAIVAQGTEAGGHGGSRSTLPFVPAVGDVARSVPVIAADGIADGRGLVAALALGAAGVLCGTGFFATHESLANENAKRAAVTGEGDDTERSSVFDIARDLDWPPGWSLRALGNSFTKQWGNDVEGFRRNLENEHSRFEAASAAGDMDVAAVIVGEAVDLVRAGEPARAVIQRMMLEGETQVRGIFSHVV